MQTGLQCLSLDLDTHVLCVCGWKYVCGFPFLKIRSFQGTPAVYALMPLMFLKVACVVLSSLLSLPVSQYVSISPLP